MLYIAAAVALIGALLAASAVLGERHDQPATGEVFESGIVAIGQARFRVPAQFYLVAMFFVIFDLEAVFLFAWAVSMREVGWLGYVEACVFVGVLLAALVYLWRCGALDWAPRRDRAARTGTK